MFRMVDVSGDGAVSKQELAARGWGDVMAEMDTDGSGEIDFPEFDAMVRIWTDVSDLISDAEFGFNWITRRLIMLWKNLIFGCAVWENRSADGSVKSLCLGSR